MLFESGGKVSANVASNVREPGENPGRLRHCDGYKFQCHCVFYMREGGMRFEAQVRIPV